MKPTEVDTLIASIESAFAGTKQGTITLHEAEALDDYATEDERVRARQLDQEADWRRIPDASLHACSNALPHLDAVSWRFYLPAFMRFALRTIHGPGCLIDRVIYNMGEKIEKAGGNR